MVIALSLMDWMFVFCDQKMSQFFGFGFAAARLIGIIGHFSKIQNLQMLLYPKPRFHRLLRAENIVTYFVGEVLLHS